MAISVNKGLIRAHEKSGQKFAMRARAVKHSAEAGPAKVPERNAPEVLLSTETT